ncbi:MAG: hypothetical protein OXE73_04310 [Gammaproteobacteria bacterium]|nr:hypothetical protein [Gammaproteobacteria bacterium]
MTSANDDLKRAVDQIRVSDAIVVLGAGASYQAGMPLAGQLSPLVWHALDRHPDVLEMVASILNVPHASAKDVVADDPERIRCAFAQIATDPPSRRTFQLAFTSLNHDKSRIMSRAHDALAELIYAKHVIRVVSLNWDTLLESAFDRRYGARINAQGRLLFKPHGDCADPDTDWVLPHEEGRVSHSIVEDLTTLANERPRTLLIVGYSEQDAAVVRRLVAPLAMQWQVFRLSPHAEGEGAIRLAAGDGLIGLAKGLRTGPEMPGWEFVTFEHQRGIEAAVAGERLGPRDVDSCPRLPHFESAQRDLDLVHRVDIAGSPGCGKSITVWQLARELNRSGWHVLRPTSPYPADGGLLLSAVKTSAWKSVLVVDDAQTLSHGSIRNLNELATPRLRVITGTTDPMGEQSRSVRIPAQIAVEVLAGHYRSRQRELLPIVRRYDSRIGDNYMSTPLEWRIDHAAESDTPWQFSFVLRSGWIQAREQLAVLRDFDRADLLFVLVASRQLLSLDAGSHIDDIVADAQAMGRTERWAAAGIDLLRSQEAIIPDDPLRCLHIRAAAIVIKSALAHRREDGFPRLLSALRRMVYDQHASVRGIYWLVDQVLGADAFGHWRPDEDKFFEPAKLTELLVRLLASASPLARRDAAFLMSRLLAYQELSKDELQAHSRTLCDWLEAATADNCYALGQLVNYMGHRTPHNELVSSMNPARLWRSVQTSLPRDGYAWGHFLGRLAYAGGSKWRARTTQALDRGAIKDLVGRFTARDLDHLAEFIQGIASFDLDFGLECVRTALPLLQSGYGANAFKAYRATRDLQYAVLGHGIFGDQRPSGAQKAVSRNITDAIRPADVATGISTCRFGDWETYARILNWVQIVNCDKHRSIVSAIPWDDLERRSVGLWQHPPRELRLLLWSLTSENQEEPVRSWIFEHVERIQRLDPILTGISPESAIAVLRRGGFIDLAGHNKSDWGQQQWALARVAEMDVSAAREILESNRAHIVGKLSNLERIYVEGLPQFLTLAKELDGSLLRRCIRLIDLESASQKWPRLLEDPDVNIRRGAARVLRIVAENSEGALRKVAQSVLEDAPAQE